MQRYLLALAVVLTFGIGAATTSTAMAHPSHAKGHRGHGHSYYGHGGHAHHGHYHGHSLYHSHLYRPVPVYRPIYAPVYGVYPGYVYPAPGIGIYGRGFGVQIGF